VPLQRAGSTDLQNLESLVQPGRSNARFSLLAEVAELQSGWTSLLPQIVVAP